MRFQFTKEQLDFQRSLATFLDANWRPPQTESEPEAIARQRTFDRALAEAGYLTMGWPVEYGGRGAGPIMRAIYAEEIQMRGAPYGNQGISIVGPALMVHGTPDQKERYIGGIARAEDFWCQGFSEPGSGSDLASLQTRAVRDGDDYVVNGQKIWTSNAWRADYMHLLVRTDPAAPKHRGISYLIVDMKSDGISVRRISQMSGGAHFCEVYVDDVRVPVKNRIGEENRGWYIATTSLDYERSGVMFSARLTKAVQRYLSQVRELGLTSPASRALAVEGHLKATIARLMAYHVAWLQEQGLVPNHEASEMKLFATEALQRFMSQAINVVGLPAQAYRNDSDDSERVASWLDSVSLTIAGGTSEVQRNIIATRGLGLPRM
jgi:alkylation response protein AidB-like acyl-CoA dehydrogenase